MLFLVLILLSHFGVDIPEFRGKMPLFMFAIASLIVGTVLSVFFSRFPLAPLRKIMAATDKLAKGDFSARINLQGPEEIQKLNASFNHMAEELGSLEILRADFVNNFSHEFKTPIVSMRGFAKILKYNDLTVKERNEYLDIIINESERLADLATNVLNLSKIENQTIATDKTLYNGSEQIRRVIALLQKKWTEKQLEINFDCDEINFYGNKELLNQVWTNMLDNAIKFSSENSTVDINIIKNPTDVAVTITDRGIVMSEETISHIFDKFYQGDTSHSSKGNGIGLTLAKRIIELHDGHISVTSDNLKTTFEVVIPMRQENET